MTSASLAGNQTAAGSNIYVNLEFDAGEIFTAFKFSTQQVAFELDNITVGVVVPEPATMLLLGTGLLACAFVGRKKYKKKA